MDSDENVLRGHRVDALSNTPPGRMLFCVRFQVPRSRARLHLANVRHPSGAGTIRPNGTMDISRGQMSLRMPPPVAIAKPHSPRMGRWKSILTFRCFIGEIRFPTPRRGVIVFAFGSRRRARALACTWLMSDAPLGLERIVPTGRWTLAGGN